MRQLNTHEIISISAGCSACQQHNLSLMAATFTGTVVGMGVTTCGLFMMPALAPVAIGSGILAFAGTSYYTYYFMLDSFIAPAA